MPLPANAGDVNYTRLLACSLAGAGADVTFMALASEETDLAAYHRACPAIRWLPVNAAPRSIAASLLSLMPLQTARYATRPFRQALHAELRQSPYDCIICDYYALGWVVREVSIRGPKRGCLVYVSHNYETETVGVIARDFSGNPVKKLLLHANAWKTARLERDLARSVDLVTVNTDEDGRQYRTLGTRRQPLTLPPAYAGRRRPARVITANVARSVVVLGSFHWIAKQMNLERFLNAADTAFARAGIELKIVGSAPPELLSRWKGRLQATSFLGFVDDLEVCFDQARMGLVIEDTGGGFKHKTLDYVFGRLPVAALAHALTGIDDDIKQHFLVENRLDLLAASVCDIIDDLDRLNSMQQGAFDAAQNRFDWDVNGKRMLHCIEDTIGQRLQPGQAPSA